MKRIDAVIRQQNLGEVRDRLTNIGVEGLTVTEIVGFGRQRATRKFTGAANTGWTFIPSCCSRSWPAKTR